MPGEHILIIEDDEDIQQLVTYNLIRSDYKVSCADNGRHGLDIAGRENPDLILLDLMLPGFDGLEICKMIRADAKNKNIPVIMLTAKGEESDVVKGLECGADDYITKPFSPKVLLARIKAVLRRKSDKMSGLEEKREKDIVSIHGMQIDPFRHEVTVKGLPIQLTVSEFNILRFLAKNPGRVYTRQQIIDEIRGYDYIISDRAVDVQVFGLRKKIGEAGKYIETVRGIGYRFRE